MFNYARKNIVNLIYYGEVMVKEDILVPYIIMPQYIENLKKYRKEKNEIKEEWKLPEELVEQLAKSRFEQRESILFNYVLFALWRI